MQLRCLIRSAAIVLMAGATAAQASAEPVQIPLEITARSTFGNLQDIFGVPVVVGDVFRGALIYDSEAVDRNPDPQEGEYFRPAGSIFLDLGTGVSLPLDGLFAFDEVFDPALNRDDAFGGFGSTQSFPGFDTLEATLDFRGSGRVGDDLPLSASEALATFAIGGFVFKGWQTGVSPPFDMGTHELFGTARILDDTAPIPEPGTLLLLATGAAACVRRYRRRASN